MLIVAGLMASAVAVTAPSAHGASIVNTEVLLDVPDGSSIPRPGDPACTRVPGVTRGGKIWADTYVDSSLGRYAGVKMHLYTRYRRSTASANAAYQYLNGGASPTCAWSNQWDGYGEVPTLRSVACASTVNAALKPARWCTLASRELVGQQNPSTVNLPVEDCREPKWNSGDWGPLGVATWHNQHVKLTTTDIYEQLGLGWIPGHLNIDSYMEDVDLLFGVANVPTSVHGRWVGFGRTQTVPASELWVRFYDAVARAKGTDPVSQPVYAHETVAHNAINNNARLTINLWPDVPSKSRSVTVNVGNFKDRLKQDICSQSPWVRDSVGDANMTTSPFIFPLPSGQCNVGFAWTNPQSSAGIGWSLREFVAANNDGVVPPDLRERYIQIPMIIREAYRNTNTVDRMLIRDPTSSAPDPPCAVQLDLGVSRGRMPDGSINDDEPDPHFRNLIKNLGSVL